MPKLYNKYHNPPKDAIYIGRGTKWGNPFVIGKDGTREEVVEKYRRYFFENQELMQACFEELRGKDLVCFCTPKACHGDILLKEANEPSFLCKVCGSWLTPLEEKICGHCKMCMNCGGGVV